MLKNLLLLTLVLFLAGCNKVAPPETKPSTAPATESAEVKEIETASNQIANAFTTGASLKCDVTKDGEPNSHYLLKNKKMKMFTDATTEQPEQYFSINDGESIYIWSSDEEKSGIKMNLEEVKKTADKFDNEFQQFPDISDPDVREDIQSTGFTMNCAPSELSDAEFVPPSDITFNDPMEMFKGMMENIPTPPPSP